MRQYPIWIQVDSCAYKGNKSYGAKDTNEQIILVGSSKSNSHELCKIINYKRITDENVIFRTKVDGILVKEMIFENKNGRAGELLNTISHLDLIENPSSDTCEKCGCNEYLCGHNAR